MNQTQRPFWKSSSGFVVMTLLAVVAYFLLIPHIEGLWQFWPLLLVLACPLMHVFLHRGHKTHDHDGPESIEQAYQRGLQEGRQQRQRD
jgi:hypothetical protein